MRFERSKVVKLVLSDLSEYRLDPVTVYLEDQAASQCQGTEEISRRGAVVIECYGQSWSARWGSMGDRTTAQFIRQVSTEYIVNCLERGICSTRFSGPALVGKARAVVIERRRGRSLDHESLNRDEARQLFDAAEDFAENESLEQAYGQNGALLHAIFGEEWWHEASRATEASPAYGYLTRIVQAVKEGLQLVEGSTPDESEQPVAQAV